MGLSGSQACMYIFLQLLLLNFLFKTSGLMIMILFEYEFVLVHEKQPIRTLYQINTLFWLDNFGIWVEKNENWSTKQLNDCFYTLQLVLLLIHDTTRWPLMWFFCTRMVFCHWCALQQFLFLRQYLFTYEI